MAQENGKLLTTGQAAKLCAVTPDTVLKWIKKGRLSASRTAGGHYRVALPDLEPFMAGFGQKSAGPTPGLPEPVPPPPDGTKGEPDEVPCWEFLSDDGEVREACRQCVVYRVKATRCFLMAGLDSDSIMERYIVMPSTYILSLEAGQEPNTFRQGLMASR